MLEKFRTSLRVAKCNQPQSTFQRRLGQLTTLNADLNRLLDEHHPAPSRSQKHGLKGPQYLVRDYQEAIELYDFIRKEGYDCECDNPHVTNFGLDCPAHSALVALPDLKSHQWKFELVLPPSGHEQSTLSHTTILEEPKCESPEHLSNSRYDFWYQRPKHLAKEGHTIGCYYRKPHQDSIRVRETPRNTQENSEAGQYRSASSTAETRMRRAVTLSSEISALLSVVWVSMTPQQTKS